MEIWVAIILLLALGFSLKILEFFFPFGGLFIVGGLVCFIGAIYLAFQYKFNYGLTTLAVVTIGTPLVLAVASQIFTRTSYGKGMILEPRTLPQGGPDDELQRQLKSLIGRLGKATCKMLPSGVIEIDGHPFEATSLGMAIEQGQTVRVIKVESNHLIVQPDTETVARETAANPLDRPIDTIIDDPFGEPLV